MRRERENEERIKQSRRGEREEDEKRGQQQMRGEGGGGGGVKEEMWGWRDMTRGEERCLSSCSQPQASVFQFGLHTPASEKKTCVRTLVCAAREVSFHLHVLSQLGGFFKCIPWESTHPPVIMRETKRARRSSQRWWRISCRGCVCSEVWLRRSRRRPIWKGFEQIMIRPNMDSQARCEVKLMPCMLENMYSWAEQNLLPRKLIKGDVFFLSGWSKALYLKYKSKNCYPFPFLLNQVEENYRRERGSRPPAKEEEERGDLSFSGELETIQLDFESIFLFFFLIIFHNSANFLPFRIKRFVRIKQMSACLPRLASVCSPNISIYDAARERMY